MNSDQGQYLPYIYIDGYIDVHGKHSIPKAVEDLTKGIVDQAVCERLNWLIGCCGNDPNKCYQKGDDSYVTNKAKVYDDIRNGKTVFYFGFSEGVAQVPQGASPYAAISVPLGQENILLQYTDALVINKARWETANEDKKNAIKSL